MVFKNDINGPGVNFINILRAVFCGFCIFSGLKFMLAFFLTGKKAASKMLVKLITGEITNHSSNSSRSKSYHSICIDHLIVTGLTLAINLIVFSIHQIQ